MTSWYYRDFYTPAPAKKVKGGIKAQTQRGAFGQSWWAKRWVAVLESFDIGARLGRGRSYARKGQVASLNIEKGVVTAEVQGSRRDPYDVTIKVKVLSRADWSKIIKALSEQALFAAKLLAGEMPESIEDVFKAQSLSLFPQKLNDLRTECSCPDWSNPCKHIAAVYYLLGEEFDRDPFLILKLRGMDREDLVQALGGLRTEQSGIAGADEHADLVAVPSLPPEPLPTDPAAFWNSAPCDFPDYGQVSIPRAAAPLAERLGTFPMWRGEEVFLDVLRKVYQDASQEGMRVYLGERGGVPRDGVD
ncbi:MAG: SWIM zinc finger family protein [Pseudomonadota bacterium]